MSRATTRANNNLSTTNNNNTFMYNGGNSVIDSLGVSLPGLSTTRTIRKKKSIFEERDKDNEAAII